MKIIFISSKISLFTASELQLPKKMRIMQKYNKLMDFKTDFYIILYFENPLGSLVDLSYRRNCLNGT